MNQEKKYNLRNAFFLKLKSQNAFTLIELLIAVAIAAVLATVAWGQYSQHIQNSRRAEAKLALVDLAGFMERQFAINRSYAPAGTNPTIQLPFVSLPKGSGTIGATPPAGAPTSAIPADGRPSFYTISFGSPTTLTATTYQLFATPVGSQATDRCGTLTLDNLGTRGIVNAVGGATVANCW